MSSPVKIVFSGPGTAPRTATTQSAGADLFAGADTVIAAGARQLVPTGLHLAIPAGFAGLIWPRSGLAVREGIDTMAGVIDSDYRGEVQVLLINHGERPCTIRRGDRVAQLLIQRVEPAIFEPVEQLPDSERGAGGFGSSGR